MGILCGSGTNLGIGADEGGVLHSGSVGLGGAGQVRIGTELFVEFDESAQLDLLVDQALVLVIGSVA